MREYRSPLFQSSRPTREQERHLRIVVPGSADRFESAERERALFAQRHAHTWVHAPGQPPFCKDVPPAEAFTAEKNRWLAEWTRHKLQERQIRFYEEPTVLYDE